MVESLRFTRAPDVPRETPFPTLDVADAIRGVFGITPTPEKPFRMLSHPDHVIFPDVVVDGDVVRYGSQREDDQGGSVTKSALAERLKQLGVEIG